jgi:hypothetical protein
MIFLNTLQFQDPDSVDFFSFFDHAVAGIAQCRPETELLFKAEGGAADLFFKVC